MCCSNRRRQHQQQQIPPQQSNKVFLFMASNMARQMYERRHAAKNNTAYLPSSPTGIAESERTFFDDEKMAMPPPPSYDEVVVNRAIIPSTASKGEDIAHDFLYDDASWEEGWVANGMRHSKTFPAAGNAYQTPVKMSCCERRRLRKAEKAARKAVERESGWR